VESSVGSERTIVALVGNPRPGSRTAALAAGLAQAVADLIQASAPAVLDLAELTEHLGAPLGADSASRWAEPLRTLHSAHLLVVATPTYKGSYTGLLKAFLDHVGAGALGSTVAVPVITVGSPAHTLAADVHLRPLLLELGAVTPTAALVVQERDLADPAGVIDAWLDGAEPALRALLAPATVRVEVGA